MKWYLISGKPDDYGACNKALIKCKKTDLKHVYEYEEIPEEDVEVLRKHMEVVNETDFEDFGYATLKDYLEEYF